MTLVLAGAMSLGAVATAQAQNGSPGSSNDHTPTATFSPNDGLRGDGSIDDNSSATPTAAPAAPNGLPTDADHPQGDDSIGRVDGSHDSDDGIDNDSFGHDGDASDDGADDSGHESNDNSGHGSDDD